MHASTGVQAEWRHAYVCSPVACGGIGACCGDITSRQGAFPLCHSCPMCMLCDKPAMHRPSCVRMLKAWAEHRLQQGLNMRMHTCCSVNQNGGPQPVLAPECWPASLSCKGPMPACVLSVAEQANLRDRPRCSLQLCAHLRWGPTQACQCR